MKTAYAIVGLGALILIAGWWLLNNLTPQNSVPPVNTNANKDMASSITLTSTAFKDNTLIPPKYTCDGEQINPPLSIGGVPEGTVSLALIMDDPDVPKQLKPDGIFDHWVLFNIPPQTASIGEGEAPGIAGANGAGKNAYTGPCPPAQYEPSTHRYFFKLYALDTMLDLKAGASKAQVEEAMKGHIVEETQLMGTYKKK